MGKRRGRPARAPRCGSRRASPTTRRRASPTASGRQPAQLLVRPRGWHLPERNLEVDGEPVSASLFDAGLYLFWNARERLARGTGPYLYLPKLQSHGEARLWNDVFVQAQAQLGIPRGSIRATVLIETIHAAFEMEEILYELREHSAGLNAGRWDYLFSCIKTFRGAGAAALPGPAVLPDRAQVTMTVPFLRAYTERLVLTCHRRGAHAMGGMAAFIPSRRDAAANEVAMRKVREDKQRESGDGFDGTWVAHPDLVPLATEVFSDVLGSAPNQRDARAGEAPLGEEVPGDPAALLDFARRGWTGDRGRRAPERLRRDPVPRRLARRQRRRRDQQPDGGRRDGRDLALPAVAVANGRRTPLDDGQPLTPERYRSIREEELAALPGGSAGGSGHRVTAATLLDGLVLDDDFTEFLTLPAYEAAGPARRRR